MNQMLSNLDIETNGQGFTDITQDINFWIRNKKLRQGILLVFLKHVLLIAHTKKQKKNL